jgi:hypothetical protein
MTHTPPRPAQTLQIGRTLYTVETETGRDGLPEYHLRGKRGAHYCTMRVARQPEVMFVVDCRGFGMVQSLQSVRLCDASGELRRAS